MTTALITVDPDLHILAFHVVMQEPAHLQDESGTGFKAHEGYRVVFHIKATGDRPCSPSSEGTRMMGQPGISHTGDCHWPRVAHQPQGQVKDMHTDVNAGAAATVFFLNECRGRDQAVAA